MEKTHAPVYGSFPNSYVIDWRTVKSAFEREWDKKGTVELNCNELYRHLAEFAELNPS